MNDIHWHKPYEECYDDCPVLPDSMNDAEILLRRAMDILRWRRQYDNLSDEMQAKIIRDEWELFDDYFTFNLSNKND